MHETILQKVRAWVLLATSLNAAKVIPVDDEGTRPAMPYITVGLTTFDLAQGQDEQILSVDGSDLYEQTFGHRRATITLNAYGKTGADLLALCNASLMQTAVKASLTAAKISIVSAAATQDISSLVDTGIEKRFVKDFFLDYAISTTATEIDEMDSLEFDAEFANNPQYTNPVEISIKG